MRGSFRPRIMLTPDLYIAAERAFGQRGLVEITYLTGIYHTVCALLNAFEIPAPGPQAQ